ncbi:MAG: DUF116 domain-containing protein [candidate division Zixibacteria bacterium]|nr:DUF116 domain-containing protein [candidate division Zixibacteria bacterium]
MKDKPTITFRLGDDFYDKLDAFTDRFLKDGLELFAKEFASIDAFRQRALDDPDDRADASFRRNPIEMYLLEAVYYRVMEQVNREAFNRAKDTVLILPDCMSLMMDRCKRERTPHGKICMRCVPNCQINKIMQIADRYHLEGYFSKRALTEQLANIKKDKPSLAVIGISCILTLASGMRSAKEAGVPSRGVFLNFTGCEHWADHPFPTETAVDRVQAILEEKYGLPDSTS